MKADDKLQIWKFLFASVNSLFVILGISLFGCSVWILFDQSNVITVLSSEGDVKVVAGGLFVIGLVVVGISMLGCIGIHLENRCVIAFYMGFLIAIVMGQLYITLLLLFKRNTIEEFLNESVDDTIRTYGVNITQTTWRLLDSVQQSAKCCGRQNASDWKANILIQDKNMSEIYPCSCFNETCPIVLENEMFQFGNGSHIYTMGCGEKLKDWFEKNLLVIAGMDFGLIIIQILQFVLGVNIYRNIGLKIKEQRSNNLLNAMEENPVRESDLYQEDVEYSQTNADSHDQYNPQHAGQNFYQYQGQKPQDLMPVQREDAGQSYDRYPYHYQNQQEHNSQTYHQKPDNVYDQEYTNQSNQYERQNYHQDRNLNYRQTYDTSYNRGYAQNDDHKNNYDCY